MKNYSEVLEKCPLFADISPEEMTALLGCLRAKTVAAAKKQTVIAEGEPARYIGVVLSGAVQITRLDYDGNRSIVAGASAGEAFGEAFACAGVDSMPVDIIASEPAQVLLLDRDRILHPCEHACGFHQKLIFNLMRVIARRNISLHQKLEITSRRTTREKLMAYLHLCARRAGSNRFTIPFDRQELADYLQVDRSGLSAEIGRLRQEGVLESRKNYFELL